jgi:hypothetical protein
MSFDTYPRLPSSGSVMKGSYSGPKTSLRAGAAATPPTNIFHRHPQHPRQRHPRIGAVAHQPLLTGSSRRWAFPQW